jgi:hypothetical protein
VNHGYYFNLAVLEHPKKIAGKKPKFSEKKTYGSIVVPRKPVRVAHQLLVGFLLYLPLSPSLLFSSSVPPPSFDSFRFLRSVGSVLPPFLGIEKIWGIGKFVRKLLNFGNEGIFERGILDGKYLEDIEGVPIKLFLENFGGAE